MTRVTLEEARKSFLAIAAQVAADGRPVRVSRGRGQRSVVIVSAAELAILRARARAAEDDEPLTASDLRAVERGRAAIARGEFVTLEEYRAGKR